MSLEPEQVQVAWLREVVTAAFTAAGLTREAAATISESLLDADMRGVPSHGVLLVPMYLERLRAGSVSTRAEATIVSDHGAIAVLDAAHAFGQLTGDQAMGLAVSKAQRHGIAAVVVRRAFHFGGAFRYVLQAAGEGCIGIAAANTRPLMPAPGGTKAVVGNNPLAVGVPRREGEAIVLDMALSEAAIGKIRLAAAEGREIPPTWATDADGRPTTDAMAALAGMLLPAAAHKGYGLAMVLDVLTGVLSGGSSGSGVRGLYADVTTPNDCAHLFIAIDVASFGPREGFDERLRGLCEEILASPRADGVERVYLPGGVESERYSAALADGVRVDPNVLAALLEAADHRQEDR